MAGNITVKEDINKLLDGDMRENEKELFKLVGHNLYNAMNGMVTNFVKSKTLIEKVEQLETIIKNNDKLMKEQNALIDKLGSSSNSSDNSDSSGSSNVKLNEGDIALILKKILLEDEDLVEFTKKIISNATAYDLDKKNVNNAVDKISSKKKNKKTVPLFFSIIFIISLISVGAYYFFFNAPLTYLLQQNEVFYSNDTNKEFSFPSSYKVTVVNEDLKFKYFIFENNTYKIPKK
jgi:hypothetical protein